MKPCAFNLLREFPVYRREAFSAGLAFVGFDVFHRRPECGFPGDVLLIWNRYGENHELACRFEKEGGIVAVAENGYIGPGGISPHHQEARTIYALARGWHNDSSVIPEGTPDRWNALGIDLKPWRTDGGHILVCPNRSFGAPGRMMPPDWGNDVAKRLRKLTKREIRIRPHPGNHPPKKPLVDDLAGAWATVIWSSSAGVHSLIAGVPVVCEARYWICHDATYGRVDPVDDIELITGVFNRKSALHRLAHGQFTLAEIESGDAFRAVLA